MQSQVPLEVGVGPGNVDLKERVGQALSAGCDGLRMGVGAFSHLQTRGGQERTQANAGSQEHLPRNTLHGPRETPTGVEGGGRRSTGCTDLC